ncbi:unnamed protein product [Rotaria sp. Silwood2]|nr:unnamed protein product [Rotaria sp. Silwood2]CAF4308051.1 unnamed protein product [Rotaria sp. Silwood2]
MISFILVLTDHIEWKQNWAFSCDFPGNDFKDVQISGDKCNAECSKTSSCTHFAWAQWQGGTCWLKKGLISKREAIKTDNPTDICGVLIDTETSDAPVPGPPGSPGPRGQKGDKDIAPTKDDPSSTSTINNINITMIDFLPPTNIWCPWRAHSCTQTIPRPGQMTIVMDQKASLQFELYLSISNDPTNESYAIRLTVSKQQVQINKIVDGLTIVLNQTADSDHVLQEEKDLYWFSIDYVALSVKYGNGEVRDKCTLLRSFVPLMEKNYLRQIQFVHVSFKGSRILSNYKWYEYKVILKIGYYPVVLDPPLLIVEPRNASLSMLLDNSAMLLTRLEEPCQKLYNDIISWKFQDDDFPYFFKAIEQSIERESGWCHKKLKEKSDRFGVSNINATYLRITITMNRGTSPGAPYVFEIWPPGHYSPIHSHANTYGIIRVVYGTINVKLYRTFNPKRTKPFHDTTLYTDQITWLSPGLNQIHKLENQSPNQTCITIQAYEYRTNEVNPYEYFDFIANDGINIGKFEPVSDMDYVEFRNLMKKEWNDEM